MAGSRFRVLLGVVVPFLILALWELTYQSGLVEKALLPSAINTIKVLAEGIVTGEILPDVMATMYRMLFGFVTACIVGMILGLIMGSSPLVYRMILPTIDFLRSVPVTTLYPVFVLSLGISDASKIGMIFTGCVFVIAINTSYGVSQANKTRRQMAMMYGASKRQVFTWVTGYPKALYQKPVVAPWFLKI